VSAVAAPQRSLTAIDRCDRCGAQAYVRARIVTGGELLFCAHHGTEHLPALRDKTVDLLDEREALLAEVEAAKHVSEDD